MLMQNLDICQLSLKNGWNRFKSALASISGIYGFASKEVTVVFEWFGTENYEGGALLWVLILFYYYYYHFKISKGG